MQMMLLVPLDPTVGTPVSVTPTPPPGWAQIALTRTLVFLFSCMASPGLWLMQASLKQQHSLFFKTTYLSYECFIQETKYEPAGWEPSQERRGTEDSCMLIMAFERVEEGKRKQAAAITSTLLPLCFPHCLSCAHFLPSLSISFNSWWQKQKSRDKPPKTEKPHEHFWLKPHSNRSILLTWEMWGIAICCSDTSVCRIQIRAGFINIRCCSGGWQVSLCPTVGSAQGGSLDLTPPPSPSPAGVRRKLRRSRGWWKKLKKQSALCREMWRLPRDSDSDPCLTPVQVWPALDVTCK